MKRKLQLNRETLRHLEDSKLTGAQGAALTTNPQYCLIESVVSCKVTCNTCVYSHCFGCP
jgi:hypothetical protein